MKNPLVSVGSAATKIKNSLPLNYGKGYLPDAKPFPIPGVYIPRNILDTVVGAINQNIDFSKCYRQAVQVTEMWADKIEKQCSAITVDKNYNPKIHGPYCEWRWYGQPEVKFMDVKLADLSTYFTRRDYRPQAVLAEVKRNYHYLRHLYIDPPYKNPYWVLLNVMFWLVAIYTVIFEFILGHKRTALQKSYYH